MVSCYSCSVAGICLSIWAIIQLSILGVCFSMESPMLLHDVDADDPDLSYEEIIEVTRKNFELAAINCYTVSYMYVLFMVFCIFMALNRRLASKAKAALLADDEYYCHEHPKKKLCQWKRK